MKKDILYIPDNNLRNISKEISFNDPKANKLVRDLLDTLRNSERPGVGLAAPQIGENYRVVVIESEGYTRDNGEWVDKIPTLILFNPIIKKYSKEKCEMTEGCLSVPKLLGNVERPKKVRVEATNEKGKNITINASGFLARVLQHEIDHLNGVLFIDLIKDNGKVWEIREEDSE